MIQDRHQYLPHFRTCTKGGNKIDYGMCSMSLLPYITSSTYEPFHLGIRSDHRGMMIDFHSRTRFGNQDHISSNNHRAFKSTNPLQTAKFQKWLTVYWKKYNISTRLSQASLIVNDKDTLRTTMDNIYSDITKALLKSERHAKMKERPPWSPELKMASLHLKLLKLYLQ